MDLENYATPYGVYERIRLPGVTIAASHPYDFVWEQLLGASVGGVGALGVAEDKRGRGIGLALAARVTELLKARGIAKSYIGWTWLVDWYGKLGYRVWWEHRMSWRRL